MALPSGEECCTPPLPLPPENDFGSASPVTSASLHPLIAGVQKKAGARRAGRPKRAKRLRTGRRKAKVSSEALDIEQDDIAEEVVLNESINATENSVVGLVKVGAEGTVASSVKMKLNSFCSDDRIKSRLRAIVTDSNIILGEAYAFANFHIIRLLKDNGSMPPINDEFYWRCINAVTKNNCTDKLFNDDFKASILLFDALRDEAIAPKVDIRLNFNQIAASLRSMMSTAAVNHLWENLDKRVSTYIAWKWPTLKRCARKVQQAVTFLTKRKETPEKCFPGDTPKALLAQQVIRDLRALLPDASGYATRAHKTLGLYARILKDTEEAINQRNLAAAGGEKMKKFTGKVFDLLPMKSGFTTSHIPISSMSFMRILRDCKLATFTGKGEGEDHGKLWAKYFNLNAIETINRRFAGTISTDGTAVSVLMTQKTSERVAIPHEVDSFLLREFVRHGAIKVSVDPGVTDVVTFLTSEGNKGSYSGRRYYEDAMFNLSNRRTTKWNKDTEKQVKDLPHNKTESLEAFSTFVKAYLCALRPLLTHRQKKGYRNMRFTRFVFKKKTVHKICDMIAPRKQSVVVGFGDWKGPNGTPISRKCVGPLQEIRRELRDRANVMLVEIGEDFTSKRCSCCDGTNNLVNMKTQKDPITKKSLKVHKVLHCRSVGKKEMNSTNDNGIATKEVVPCTNSSNCKINSCCGKTFDRDDNASKNIMTLLNCIIEDMPRPERFCRPTTPTVANKEPKVAKVPKVPKVLKVPKVAKVPKEPKVAKVPKVPKPIHECDVHVTRPTCKDQ